VVLGVAPGLNAVGYCVIDVDTDGMSHCLDYDVLMGNRAAQLERAGADLSLANLAQLVLRFRVHAKIIGVLFERHYPAVLAIGPAALTKEPPEHIRASRSALVGMATLFGVRVIDVTQADMKTAFPTEKKLHSIVLDHLATPIESRDRRVLRAAGSALAAAQQVRAESR